MSELMNDQENLDMYDSTDSNENSTVERCLTFESGDLVLYVSLGILVDSVRQVVDINLKNVRPIPLKRQQKLLDGMVIMDDGSVFMSIDCQALSSTDE